MDRTRGLTPAISFYSIYFQIIWKTETSLRPPYFGYLVEKYFPLYILYSYAMQTNSDEANILQSRFLLFYLTACDCSGSSAYFRYLISHLKASVQFASDLCGLLIRVVQLKEDDKTKNDKFAFDQCKRYFILTGIYVSNSNNWALRFHPF